MADSKEVLIPDIGGATDVEVIEVMVKPGDQVQAEDSLIVLESDKASMDMPAPFAGTIKEIKVKTGDKVSEGDLILLMKAANETETSAEKPAEEKAQAPVTKSETNIEKPLVQAPPVATTVTSNADVYAGPAVRRLANQLGVDLKNISGTGRKNRIVIEDIHTFVKRVMQGGGISAGAGFSIAAAPRIDFAKFGDVEVQPLSRIKKLSGANLHRNWVTVPHVTQFDEADITDLEDFRKANKKRVENQGAKLTPLVFIMKAVVSALKAHPQFNSSLEANGESLVIKKYFHIGVAVDTPNGLMVPVIRDVDRKGFMGLALELGEISKRAREGKIKSNEMQGGCFSISSLGGIGGTAFTPIVNSPEVAILGVSRSAIKPQFIDDEFKPRLMLPLCLSYDHRVIDGADAARFITHLSACLADLRQILV